MKPLRISCTDFGPYKNLDLDVEHVTHAAVVGPNGAGKSFLIDAVRYAIYGSGRTDADGLVRHGALGFEVEVEVEHRGRCWKFRRTRTTGKRSKGTFEVHRWYEPTGVWSPLEKSAVEAFPPLEAADATVFLASHGIKGLGEFGSAAAADRRRILVGLRGLEVWRSREQLAKQRVTATANSLAVRADELQRLLPRIEEAGEASSRLAVLEAALAEAERDLNSVRASAPAPLPQGMLGRAKGDRDDAWRRARAATARVVALDTRIAEADAALRALDALVADAAAVRAAVAERDALRAEWPRADRERRVAEEALRSTEDASRTAAARAKADDEHARASASAAFVAVLVPAAEEALAAEPVVRAADRADPLIGSVPCKGAGPYAACRLLGNAAADAEAGPAAREALARASGVLGVRRPQAVLFDASALRERAEGARARLEALPAPPGVVPDLVVARDRFERAAARCDDILARGRVAGERAAREVALAGAEAERSSLVSRRDEALRDREDAVETAAAARREADDLVERVTDLSARSEADTEAGAVVRGAEAKVMDLVARTSRQRTLAEQEITLNDRAGQLEAECAGLRRRWALAGLLSTFYREAPAILLERDLRTAEAEANLWLRSTSSLQVRLDTQRTAKTTGNVAETLDVYALVEGRERLRESLSGSEQFRLDLALAVGLGRALGQDTGFVWLDEGFGTLQGQNVDRVATALADVLAGGGTAVWAITHVPQVVALFPARIEVDGGEARVVTR